MRDLTISFRIVNKFIYFHIYSCHSNPSYSHSYRHLYNPICMMPAHKPYLLGMYLHSLPYMCNHILNNLMKNHLRLRHFHRRVRRQGHRM